MAKKFITSVYTHTQLNGAVRNILQKTKARENTRYAINFIHVLENKFVATDGRKLVVVEISHPVSQGLHHITQDGFLLPCPDAGNFPKHEDILLKPEAEGYASTTIGGDIQSQRLFSNIVYHLNQADMLFDLFLFQESIMCALKAADYEKCTIETAKDGPFQLRFDIENKHERAKIIFLQMPINKQ